MLGLFLLLPVLALYARTMPDYSPVLLGLAMGAYGLTQAVLQIPFGRWSDRYGRKPVIAVGLLFYAAGSLIGAFAHSLAALLVARLVQGAGAVSAAVTALLADLTRPEVRTRAMAFVGISIGLSFILALVLAPVLDSLVGVPGIFLIMLAMAVAGLVLLYFAVPVEPARSGGAEGRTLSAMVQILVRPELRPLYAGVFALHFIMTATFLSVPQVLALDLGIPMGGHWKVYLGVFLVSLAGTIPLVLATERTGHGRLVFVAAILLVGVRPGAARPRPPASLAGAGGADAVLRGVQLPRGAPAGSGHAGSARLGPGSGARRVRHVPVPRRLPRRRGRWRAAGPLRAVRGLLGQRHGGGGLGPGGLHGQHAAGHFGAKAPDSLFPPGRPGAVNFHPFPRG